jgi:hypothetical protein
VPRRDDIDLRPGERTDFPCALSPIQAPPIKPPVVPPIVIERPLVSPVAVPRADHRRRRRRDRHRRVPRGARRRAVFRRWLSPIPGTVTMKRVLLLACIAGCTDRYVHVFVEGSDLELTVAPADVRVGVYGNDQRLDFDYTARLSPREAGGIPASDFVLLVDDLDGQVDFRGASGEVAFDLTTGDIKGPFFINVWTISGGAVTDLRIERIDPP